MTLSDNYLVNYTARNVANEPRYVEFHDWRHGQPIPNSFDMWWMLLMANPGLRWSMIDGWFWIRGCAFGLKTRNETAPLLCARLPWTPVVMVTRVLRAVFLSRASQKKPIPQCICLKSPHFTLHRIVHLWKHGCLWPNHYISHLEEVWIIILVSNVPEQKDCSITSSEHCL